MDPAFGERHLNEGFSGGEKKRNEILQMAMLEPELAILDETDSGLDIDALRIVARGVHTVREARPELGVLVDHPLPAHARRAGRRSGAPARRRRSWWPKAGPSWPGRSRPRATTHGATERDRRHGLDVRHVLRKDFPLLAREVNGRPIVYLDSAASAQRPVQVLDAMRDVRRDHPRQRAPGRLRHRRGGRPAASRRPG